MILLSVTSTLVFVAFLHTSFGQVDPLVLEQQVLWEKHFENVSTYRIPLITYTPINKWLLAFSEAREDSSSDYSRKRVAMRVSYDGGYLWQPNTFILDSGNNTHFFLGSTVVDDMKNTTFLFFTINITGVNANCYIKSLDDGLTWSQPVNITPQIGEVIFKPGPGHGIQIKNNKTNKGRLIVCGHTNGDGDARRDVTKCIYSDDHGQEWKNGLEYVSVPFNHPKKDGDLTPSETVLVEFNDGTLYLNIRNDNHYHCTCRFILLSSDSGETYNPKSQKMDPILIDSSVAGAVEYTGDVLYFSIAYDPYYRQNMSLLWSYDQGVTWNGSLVLWSELAGYVASTTNPIHPNQLFMLFENGLQTYSDYITFQIIDLYMPLKPKPI